MDKISSAFSRQHFVALSILVGSLVFLWPVSAFAQLNMWFTNTSSYANSNVWITIQRGQNPATDVTVLTNRPNVTYGSALTSFNWQMYSNATGTVWVPGTYGNLFSETVSLADIVNASGGDRGLLTWSGYADSAAVYISYGTPFIGGTAALSNNYTVSGVSPNNPSDPNYRVAYQPFEITYGSGANGTPAPGDQGDLTAINYFTAALQIQSFTNTSGTGTALQQVGFTQTGPQIGASLTNITAGNSVPSGGAEGNAGGTAVITNGSGEIIRVLGPSTFGVSPTNGWGYGTYANFDSYLAGAGSNNASFTNNSAYNTMSGTPSGNYTNKNVSFAFNNSVTNTVSGYALNPTGTFTVVTTVYTNSAVDGAPSTNTYSNIVFNVNPTAQGGQGASVISNITSQFIYGGSFTAFNGGIFTNTDGTPATYSWFEGGDWAAFSNSLSGFVDGGGTNGIMDITAQVAGEISTGFAAGFVGSEAYGSLPSDQWWALDPTNAFSGATANSNNYNQYAAVIAEASSNTVYGMVYSDRFIEASPLINSVSLNGTNIGSWLITINDPITAVPEPSTYALLAMAGAGLAGYMLRRRKR
jgi:hypothetical protein